MKCTGNNTSISLGEKFELLTNSNEWIIHVWFRRFTPPHPPPVVIMTIVTRKYKMIIYITSDNNTSPIYSCVIHFIMQLYRYRHIKTLIIGVT